MSAPAVIKKLDEVVINRIAAGEVIQRPANALKELLENSLDAKSTNIQITIKGGGLKFLQIQDNGTGIRKEDMEIVCERFTTSKLKQFEDLGTIATFGFRGEALASISHVAHLTIVTKTASEVCAYKGCYEDSKLTAPLKACAGNQGTQITVEDLFYNISTRRKAFKNHSEEHARVADVVSKYAVHNPSVGFTLKKQGENLSDIRTNPNSTHIDNIRTIYGNNIARELLEVQAVDDGLQFQLKGYISNVNYSTKKAIFLLFINNRLVDSSAMRRALDTVYNLYLPKGAHPFMYLSLSLNPRNVDVNVHPTKREVHFLHEENIIDNVRKAIEEKLQGANISRVFHTQVRLPGADAIPEKSSTEKPQKQNQNTTPAHKLVRTDSTAQKLDKFFAPGASSASKPVSTPPPSQEKSLSQKGRRKINLTSVLNLRKEIEEDTHSGLSEIMSNFTFVGCADQERALIQHGTNLYVCNTKRLLEELFYQIMIYEFGNFGIIKFKDPLPLRELCKIGLDFPEAGWEEEDGSKEELSLEAANLLSSKALMLKDYFSFEIDEQDNVLTIPLLLTNYVPDMSGLPMYMLRVACDVDWDSEQACFKTFCRETAHFYSRLQKPSENKGEKQVQDWKWTVEHIIYPSLKSSFMPPRRFSEDRTVVQVASLPDLYKVFERC